MRHALQGSITVFVVDVPQRIRESPSAVGRIQHPFDARFKRFKQTKLHDTLHGFVEVVFKCGVILLPHIAEGHRVFTARFDVEQHEVGQIVG